MVFPVSVFSKGALASITGKTIGKVHNRIYSIEIKALQGSVALGQGSIHRRTDNLNMIGRGTLYKEIKSFTKKVTINMTSIP